MEKELSIFPSEKVTRFSAIREKYGAMGCTKSHIAVLEMAIRSGWKNVLIMEDDMTFVNPQWELLEEKMNSYDVIVIGASWPIYDKTTLKLSKCYCTGGYIVNSSYYTRLLANFKEGLALYIKNVDPSPFPIRKRYDKTVFAIDTWWNKLQQKDNWILVQMLSTITTYSDVTHNTPDYTQRFIVDKMFDFIEKVVYINLDERTDRREQIESELSKFPSEKVQRFSAIKHEKGAIGCTQSHIAVLEMAISEGWSNYLVIEDDAKWSNFDKGYPLLQQLCKNHYDVIVLGSVFPKTDSNFKLTSCQTTTAFLVNKPYYQTLLTNFKEGLAGLVKTGNYPTYAIDQYWHRLQPPGKWYAVVPSLMIQRPSFSDINKAFVDYQHLFT
jgi:glycosyl transferase family 25